MPVEVELHGASDAVRRLRRLESDIQGDLGGAWDDIGALGARLTGQAAPRLTGRLARSWQPRRVAGGAQWYSRLVYAGVIDRGGYHGIKGRRYTQAALRRLDSEAGRVAELGAEKAIREAGLA